jgi:hypothetical protein
LVRGERLSCDGAHPSVPWSQSGVFRRTPTDADVTVLPGRRSTLAKSERGLVADGHALDEPPDGTRGAEPLRDRRRVGASLCVLSGWLGRNMLAGAAQHGSGRRSLRAPVATLVGAEFADVERGHLRQHVKRTKTPAPPGPPLRRSRPCAARSRSVALSRSFSAAVWACWRRLTSWRSRSCRSRRRRRRSCVSWSCRVAIPHRFPWP